MTSRGALVSELLEKELELVGVYRRSLRDGADPVTLNALTHALANLEHVLREKMQEETRDRMEAIIKVLEKGGDPDLSQKDLIRAWIVGDAEHHVRTSNDSGGGAAELDRLLEHLATAQGRTLSPAQLIELQATVGHALRMAADVHFFQEQRARVERYRAATADWSAEEKKILARMLRAKLQSNED